MKTVLIMSAIMVSSLVAGSSIIVSNNPVPSQSSNGKSIDRFIKMECVIVRKGEKCVEDSKDGICCVEKRKK